MRTVLSTSRLSLAPLVPPSRRTACRIVECPHFTRRQQHLAAELGGDEEEDTLFTSVLLCVPLDDCYTRLLSNRVAGEFLCQKNDGIPGMLSALSFYWYTLCTRIRGIYDTTVSFRRVSELFISDRRALFTWVDISGLLQVQAVKAVRCGESAILLLNF